MSLTIIIQIRQLESQGTEDRFFIKIGILGKDVHPNGGLAFTVRVLGAHNVLSWVSLDCVGDLEKIVV